MFQKKKNYLTGPRRMERSHPSPRNNDIVSFEERRDKKFDWATSYSGGMVDERVTAEHLAKGPYPKGVVETSGGNRQRILGESSTERVVNSGDKRVYATRQTPSISVPVLH